MWRRRCESKIKKNVFDLMAVEFSALPPDLLMEILDMMILFEMKMRCYGSCGVVVVRAKSEKNVFDLIIVEFSAPPSDLLMEILDKRRIVWIVIDIIIFS